MRISDWSSDVCSSDLASPAPLPPAGEGGAQRRVRARLLILRVRAVRGSRPSALLPRAAFELQALALPDGVARCLEVVGIGQGLGVRSEEHTSELQSLMRTSYAVFCLKKKNKDSTTNMMKRIQS